VRRSLENIVRLGGKELFSLRRDGVLMFLIVYAFTYGVLGPAKGVSMDVKDASIAIVDEEHSSELLLRWRSWQVCCFLTTSAESAVERRLSL